MTANGLESSFCRILLVGMICGVTVGGALGQEASAEQPSADKASLIAPKADALMKMMGISLKTMKAFSFSAEISSDELTSTGEKVESHRKTNFLVIRPGLMKGQATGGPEMDKSFVYDGKQLTILDHAAKVYSSTDVPASIDQMLDHVFEKYGISVPTADFLYEDVYKILTSGAESGRYIGETKVNGQRAYHIAVRMNAVDYQLWIAAGDKPLPVRMVVTYKEIEGMPQFRINFSDWSSMHAAQMQIPDFKVDIPSTYTKVDLQAPKMPTDAPVDVKQN